MLAIIPALQSMKGIETMRPQNLLLLDPACCLIEWDEVERDQMLAPLSAAVDQARSFQNSNVFRNRIEWDRERLSDSSYACLAVRQSAENWAPGRIRESQENEIETHFATNAE
jgi:hypothetical protein